MAEAVVRITAQNETAAAFRTVLRDGNDLANGLKSVFQAAFVGLSVASIWDNVKGALDYGDAIGKAAEKSGIAVAAFSQLAYAAKQNDIDIQALSKSIKAMQVAVSDGSDAFAKIGIPLDQLRKLNPDQQFKAIAEGLSRIKDPADRTADAVKIFGKNGADLLPLFEQGAAGVDKLTQEAQDLGLTLDELTSKQIKDAHDAVVAMDSSWDALWRTLSVKVAPVIGVVADELRKLAGGSTPLEKLQAQLDDLIEQRKALTSATQSRDTAPLFAFTDTDAQFAALFQKIQDVRRKIQALSSGSGDASVAVAIVGTPEQAQAATAKSVKAIESELRVSMTRLKATMAQVDVNGQWLQDFQRTITEEQSLTETSAEKQLDSWNKFYAALTDLRSRNLIDATEFQKREAEQLNQLLPEFETSVKHVTVAHHQALDDMSEYAKRAAQNMQDAFANFLFDPFKDGLRGLLTDFINVIRQMVAQAAAAKIFDALKSGSSSGSFFGSILSGLLGGGGGGAAAGAGAGASGAMEDLAFATGGSFTVGGSGGTDTQRVAFRATPGERVSVTRPGDSVGGGIHITNTIDARGATTDLVAALPEILKRNNEKVTADIIDGLRRRKIRV